VKKRAKKVKVVFEKNKKNKWYFKYVAMNGRILCHSEAYSSWTKAHRGFEATVADQYLVRYPRC